MIHTNRLIIRPYEESDFAAVYRMAQNAEVVRFIRPVATEEGPVRERMQVTTDYGLKNPGMGSFIIEIKADKKTIGNMVLRHADWNILREMEVGYSLEPEYWGKGLATEALLGLMDYAISNFHPPILIAYTDPENIASNRVLKKCGFIHAGTEFIYEHDLFRWEFFR